ncbi:hypothetical protein QZH44_20415 [Pseudomonas corrugata]|uniref:hypothetical protein n=1 Tax=Pseudomonas corrugata TaxID=47879 RepID=UPI003D81931B
MGTTVRKSPSGQLKMCQGSSPRSAKGYHDIDALRIDLAAQVSRHPASDGHVRVRGLPVLFPYVALPAIDVQAFPKAALAIGNSFLPAKKAQRESWTS